MCSNDNHRALLLPQIFYAMYVYRISVLLRSGELIWDFHSRVKLIAGRFSFCRPSSTAYKSSCDQVLLILLQMLICLSTLVHWCMYVFVFLLKCVLSLDVHDTLHILLHLICSMYVDWVPGTDKQSLVFPHSWKACKCTEIACFMCCGKSWATWNVMLMLCRYRKWNV